MKNNRQRTATHLLVGSILALLAAGTTQAAKFSSAKVSKKVNVVELLLPDGSRQSAQVGSTVSGSTAVQTGSRSRAQLSFPDESVIRLGSNSVFSFTEGERDVQLDQGTMLMQSKRFRGKTSIKTAAVTAAIRGTTIMIEYIPPVLDASGKVIKPGIIKIIVIEGSLEFALNINLGKKMILGAGEMVILSTEAKQLPKKFTIDLGRLTETARLLAGGLGPLPKQDQIQRAVNAQRRVKSNAGLVAVSTAEPHFNDRDAHNAHDGRNRPPEPPPVVVVVQPPSDDGPAPPRPPEMPPMCVDISGPPPPECVNQGGPPILPLRDRARRARR